jgi:hypothetical protein
MGRFLGVTTDPFHLSRSLKREALLFDQIYATKTNLVDSILPAEKHAEVEWLIDRGILRFISDELSDQAMETMSNRGVLAIEQIKVSRSGLVWKGARVQRVIEKLRGETQDERTRNFLSSKYLLYGWLLFHSNLARAVRVHLQTLLQQDAALIFSPLNDLPTQKAAARASDNVVRIILHQLPQPDESTPWEVIHDFRSDSEARGKFLRLKKWMNEVSREDIPLREKEDRLEWLLHEYEEHLRLHDIKFKRSAFESLVIMGTGILEHTVKLRWSEAAKTLFSLRQQKGILLEAELKAPGRELAYIAHARSRFRAR